MREQIEHVIELSKRTNVHVHILPTRTGANLGLGGPVHLATGIGTPDVLLVGALIEDQVSADPALVRRASAMIADFEAQCVLGDDELWRFQSHVLRPIFVGSDLPASISIDPQRL